jgi:hypothetical protein
VVDTPRCYAHPLTSRPRLDGGTLSLFRESLFVLGREQVCEQVADNNAGRAQLLRATVVDSS